MTEIISWTRLSKFASFDQINIYSETQLIKLTHPNYINSITAQKANTDGEFFRNGHVNKEFSCVQK